MIQSGKTAEFHCDNDGYEDNDDDNDDCDDDDVEDKNWNSKYDDNKDTLNIPNRLIWPHYIIF